MEKTTNICFTYILMCGDNSLYTGWTNDIDRRISAHSQGKGAKYTKARLPVKLVYLEKSEDKSSAMKREYAIKQLTRAQKEQLIASNCNIAEQYIKYKEKIKEKKH